MCTMYVSARMMDLFFALLYAFIFCSILCLVISAEFTSFCFFFSFILLFLFTSKQTHLSAFSLLHLYSVRSDVQHLKMFKKKEQNERRAFLLGSYLKFSVWLSIEIKIRFSWKSKQQNTKKNRRRNESLCPYKITFSNILNGHAAWALAINGKHVSAKIQLFLKSEVFHWRSLTARIKARSIKRAERIEPKQKQKSTRSWKNRSGYSHRTQLIQQMPHNLLRQLQQLNGTLI